MKRLTLVVVVLASCLLCHVAWAQSPQLQGLSTYSGSVGTPVTLYGDFFGSPGMVTFNGTPAGISSWGQMQIQVTVPDGATSGDVVVATSEGLESNGIGFQVSTTPPAAPGALSATSAGNGLSVSLTWTDNATNEDSYMVQRCTGDSCGPTDLVELTGDSTIYTDSTTTAGTRYGYKVCALNSAGRSCSATVYVTTSGPPASPTGLSGNSAANSLSVSLAWTDNATNETSYKVQRCTGNSCNPTDLTTGLAADRTSYTDSPTTAGTTYGYKVCAVNSAGTSCTATVYVATPPPPAAPSSLAGTSAGDGRSVSLTWTDNATNETSYKVQRCTGNGCTPSDLVTGLAVNKNSYTDNTTTPNTTYGYKSCAVNAVGTSCSPVVYVPTTITKQTPSVTVSCSANPTTYRVGTTCTVHTSGGTGTFTFSANGTTWTTVAVDGSGNGSAVGLNGPEWTPGAYPVSVTYNGDANYNSASASTSVTINMADVTLTLSSSSNPSAYGQEVTFTCTAKEASGNNVVNGTLLGIYVDGVLVANPATTNGSATWRNSSLVNGTHDIGCTVGDGRYKPAAAHLSQVISELACN